MENKLQNVKEECINGDIGVTLQNGEVSQHSGTEELSIEEKSKEIKRKYTENDSLILSKDNSCSVFYPDIEVLNCIVQCNYCKKALYFAALKDHLRISHKEKEKFDQTFNEVKETPVHNGDQDSSNDAGSCLVKVKAQSSRSCPVNVKAQSSRSCPVKVKAQSSRSCPVNVKTQSSRSCPVKVKAQSSRSCPVKTKSKLVHNESGRKKSLSAVPPVSPEKDASIIKSTEISTSQKVDLHTSPNESKASTSGSSQPEVKKSCCTCFNSSDYKSEEYQSTFYQNIPNDQDFTIKITEVKDELKRKKYVYDVSFPESRKELIHVQSEETINTSLRSSESPPVKKEIKSLNLQQSFKIPKEIPRRTFGEVLKQKLQVDRLKNEVIPQLKQMISKTKKISHSSSSTEVKETNKNKTNLDRDQIADKRKMKTKAEDAKKEICREIKMPKRSVEEKAAILLGRKQNVVPTEVQISPYDSRPGSSADTPNPISSKNNPSSSLLFNKNIDNVVSVKNQQVCESNSTQKRKESELDLYLHNPIKRLNGCLFPIMDKNKKSKLFHEPTKFCLPSSYNGVVKDQPTFLKGGNMGESEKQNIPR